MNANISTLNQFNLSNPFPTHFNLFTDFFVSPYTSIVFFVLGGAILRISMRYMGLAALLTFDIFCGIVALSVYFLYDSNILFLALSIFFFLVTWIDYYQES